MDRVPLALRVAALGGACVLIVGATIYAVGSLLGRVAPLSLAVVVALLLTALISPVAAVLRRIGAPSWLAALGGLLSLLLAIALPLAVVSNRTAAQWPELRRSVGGGLQHLRDLLLNGPLPITQRQLDSAVDGLVKAARKAAPDPVGGATAAAEVVTGILLALVLLFFLLRDGPQIWQWALRAAPEQARHRVDVAARAGWQTIVSYVRGTVLVALVDALGIGTALLLIGVPLALPLTLLTFMAAFIPIVGATVAGAVAVLVALVSNGVTDALLVLGAVLLVQQAEGHLLQPLIMGRALRLHPAVVLMAVTAGTLLGGIAGAVIAVPLTAVTYRVIATFHATAEPVPAGAPPPVSVPERAGGEDEPDRDD
ncbi:AI-2E family transporter [Actinomadura craniellae]|uniref:AI-2E family transporter n=2 Tax=Actinomadura craniellae TaxID=2231787 RepID=A0A365HBN7_9ACTN|nr:AI-2E family transporter [Actinomadura craniellae]